MSGVTCNVLFTLEWLFHVSVVSLGWCPLLIYSRNIWFVPDFAKFCSFAFFCVFLVTFTFLWLLFVVCMILYVSFSLVPCIVAMYVPGAPNPLSSKFVVSWLAICSFLVSITLPCKSVTLRT